MKTLTKYFDVVKLPNEIKNPVIDVARIVIFRGYC